MCVCFPTVFRELDCLWVSGVVMRDVGLDPRANNRWAIVRSQGYFESDC